LEYWNKVITFLKRGLIEGEQEHSVLSCGGSWFCRRYAPLDTDADDGHFASGKTKIHLQRGINLTGFLKNLTAQNKVYISRDIIVVHREMEYLGTEMLHYVYC
jgi:hypothetical protein